MKIPYIDRKKLTPRALRAKLVGANGERSESAFANPGLLRWSDAHEQLAMHILNYCVKVRGWKPFTMRQAKEFAGDNSGLLPQFVRAGLLVEADGRYLITDVLILWFAEHLRKPEARAQSVWRCVVAVLKDCAHILYLYNHELWFVKRETCER